MKPDCKTLAPIFALLAIALFAGCSDGNDGGSGANDTVTAATAETITASELVGTSWTGTTIDYTYTLYFSSGNNVTYSYVSCDSNESYNYTYSVNGSTITIYDDDKDVYMQLTYLSGQLVRVEYMYTPVGSSGSGSAVSLAGTTWTCTYADFYTMTLEFYANGGFKITSTIPSGASETGEGTYNVSGSTVTLDGTNKGDSFEQQLIYYSGKLIYSGLIFTKVS